MKITACEYAMDLILWAAPAFLLSWAGPARGGDGPVPADVRFNRDVRPILADKCLPCHGPDANHRKGKLRLDDQADTRRDRDGHRVIEPGDPDASELIARVEDEDAGFRMPPPAAGKDLTPSEAAVLRRWVEQGGEYESHWSFTPPRRPPVPDVRDGDWPAGAIDRFILAPIEAAGTRPSPEADRATLLRRLSFDLIGLPPTPEEVDAFLADRGPDAWARQVDRLLASPHFGERLAIVWFDLVRYANTVGYHGDQEHHIAPYRDWVIRALNTSMPFDRFTIEQLAGDLLPGATVDQRVATGYNRLLQTTHEGGAQDKEYRAKYAADRVRNLASVWMGATMGCAECHDHKYDPYTQRDFYALAAFFADVDELGAYKGPDKTPTVRAPEIDVLDELDREELARLDRSIAEAQDERAAQTLKAQREAVLKRARRTMVTVAVEPRVMRVLPRGDWLDDSGPVVTPAIPAFMGRLDVGERRPTRLDLARWLVSSQQPQTARVMVNRLWYLAFCEGLARGLDDNGAQGTWPTHPDLLDWLAVEFVESGWDLKHVLRLIVSSRAYRLSSRERADLAARDPENRLFARQNRPRLPAELVRDAALAASGLLVRKVGGAVARPYQPAGYYEFLNFPKREYQPDRDEEQYRRGVYMHWQRQFTHPMLRALDAPQREECTARRPISNTPLAALALLNDPSFVEAARALATRVVREARPTPEDRVQWAWKLSLARPAEAREVAAALRHLDSSRADFAADPAAAEALVSVGLTPRPNDVEAVELAAWTSVCRALLNLHESITRN